MSGDRHHAEALREQVSAVIAPLGLRLAPEKTRVVHIDEGFDFLGFHIRRMRKRGTNQHYVYTTPSRTSIQKARNRLREKTYRSTRNGNLDELITSLNRFLQSRGLHARGEVSGDRERDLWRAVGRSRAVDGYRSTAARTSSSVSP